MPLVEIKGFNSLIGNKSLLISKQKACEELAKMSRNDDSATRYLLDYLYHQKYCGLIGINLSRQTIKNISQKI